MASTFDDPPHITESIINSLSQLSQIRVIARSTVFHYKGKEIEPQRIGRELGVRAVLTGKVVQRGDGLSVQAELVDVANGSQLWGQQYNQKLSDVLAVQEEISRKISENLQLKLSGEEQKRLTKRHSESVEAYQLYMKGRYHWNKYNEQGFKRGIEYFKQAIDIDPNYALAYAGLADAYYTISNIYMQPQEAMPKARGAAQKALEIDDTLGEAYAAMAIVNANYYWEWLTAEREFKRAVELSPNYATAHHYYGLYLVENGRFDEATHELVEAQRLDPLSLSIAVTAVYPVAYGRQYDEAIKRLQKIIEMDPDFYPAHVLLGETYENKKLYDEAITEIQKAHSLGDSWFTLAYLGHAYAVSGRRSEAQMVLDQLRERAKRSHVSPFGMAMVYAGLSEKDQAFMWLEKAYEERAEELLLLKVDPKFDSLRSDPRFASLLRRIGLAP